MSESLSDEFIRLFQAYLTKTEKAIYNLKSNSMAELDYSDSAILVNREGSKLD